MRAFARMMGLPVFGKYLGCARPLAEQWCTRDRAGAPAAVCGPTCAGHPDEAAIFNSAMQSKAHADIGAVISAYDFRPFNAIADVAGGHGHLLRAVLESAPNSHGILFEPPEVLESLPEPGPRSPTAPATSLPTRCPEQTVTS